MTARDRDGASMTKEISINVAPAPITPAAPNCSGDDTTNTINCGGLVASTLETSTNGGSTWTTFNAATTYAGNQTVLIRVKASGINPAGEVQTLNFTTNPPVDPAPTSNGSMTYTTSDNFGLPFTLSIANVTDSL